MSAKPHPPSTADELRELTREANSTIKALRQAERDAKDAHKALEQRVRELYHEHMQATIDAGMAAYRQQLTEAIDKARESALELIQRKANKAMYGNEKGHGMNIFDAFRARLEGEDVRVFRDIAPQAANDREPTT